MLINASSLILTSCGPNACECIDNMSGKQYYRNIDGSIHLPNSDLQIRCNEYYGSDIPDSFRGTEKFSIELKRILEKECSN